MTYASQETWIGIGRYSERAEADASSLALAAIGIGSRLVVEETGIALFVLADDAPKARRELLEYIGENHTHAPVTWRSPSDGLAAALAFCAVLMFTHVAAGRQLFGLDWFAAGHVQAGLIVGGEWWRAITALGLHADLGHLASNTVAGGVFGLLLAQSLGPGLAWFAVLLAAGFGNALNALVQPAEHAAVGASTAVFAALGLLSALMWRRQANRWSRGLRRWLPLAAGATLLAYLGMGGARTDILAHVMGFVVGVAFGVGLNVLHPWLPRSSGAQYGLGAAALAIFLVAWIAAFHSA